MTDSKEAWRFDAREPQFATWAQAFNEFGFLILEHALTPIQIQSIQDDLHKQTENRLKKYLEDAKCGPPIDWPKKDQKKKKTQRHIMHKCFFEESKAVVDLLEDSVLSQFADFVIGDVPDSRKGNTSLMSHMFHNNAFSVPAKNGKGQATVWHVDDPLQNIILPPNVILPDEWRLPVLAMTYMIWLSDCPTPAHGPTKIIPKSHRFCRPVDQRVANRLQHVHGCGPAGTAVLVNCQTWHAGAKNTSDHDRDTLQMSFGRRIIGHKYGSIMNYHMPESVFQDRSETCKRKLGFLQGGAYS